MNVVELLEKKQQKKEPVYAPVERTTFTVDEIAKYLGVSRDLIYKLSREKKIPHIRLGGRIMFKKDTIDRWLSNLEKESCEF